jgi:hypothetical protein
MEELRSGFATEPGITSPFLLGGQAIKISSYKSVQIFEALKVKFCCETSNFTRGSMRVSFSFLGIKAINCRAEIGTEVLRILNICMKV